MAEGGYEEVMNQEVDCNITSKIACNICSEDDSFRQANWRCKECKIKLCDKCRKHHGEFEDLKNHTAERIENLQDKRHPRRQIDFSDELRMPLCKKHNQPIELFCNEHDDPVCASCKLIDHRKCNTLEDIERVAIKNSSMWNDVSEHLKWLETGMENVKRLVEKKQDMLNASKDNIIRKIKQKIKEVEILGEMKIAEVESKFKEVNEDINKDREIVTCAQAMLSESLSALDQVKKVGSQEESFLVATDAKLQASKYQEIFEDGQNTTYCEMTLDLNCKLANLDSFGQVTVNKESVEFENEVVVKQVPEIVDVISWFENQKNDCIVTLSWATDDDISHLRLHSANGTVLSSLEFPKTLSAVTINDHQVVVSRNGEQCLQIVDIKDNNMTLGRMIKMKTDDFLVTMLTPSSLLIMAEDRDEKVVFQILDLSGRVQRNIAVKTDVALEAPAFLAVGDGGNAFYVLDSKLGCLGYNLEGNRIFHYQDKNHSEIDLYIGLAVDCVGHIYTGCNNEKTAISCIVRLSRTGKFMNKVQQCKDQWVFPVKCVRNKLYVVTISEDKCRTGHMFV